MPSQTDLTQELLVAIGAGDQRALRRLYEATSQHLLAILIRRLGSRDIAEEALQECFIKIWQKAHTFDPARGQAMSWLTAIVRNRALDMLRYRRPDEWGDESETELALCVDESADPSRSAEISEGISIIQDSLRRLPPQMRKSVLLTHYSGHTNEESALLLGAPLGTVKAWVRRGLTQLRNDQAIQNRFITNG